MNEVYLYFVNMKVTHNALITSLASILAKSG